MKRYSASYIYNQSNFVLLGIDEPIDTGGVWHDLACVVLNILQRGAPTPIPARLHELLGDIPKDLSIHPRPIDKSIVREPRWEKTIKGAPDGNSNPAKVFFTRLLPEALPPEYRFIMNYILPEALITDIVEDYNQRYLEQRVDFYCPRARLVIEIDGSQHRQAGQSRLDMERDRYLRQYGIRTIRISTSNMSAAPAAKALVTRFDLGDTGIHDMSELEAHAVLGCEMAMRAQIAVAECVKAGILNPERPLWEIELRHDEPNIDYEAVFNAAVEDVLDLFENLCVLRGVDFTRPGIQLRKGADDLCLDLSATCCWSELEASAGVVYVRNDYFDNRNNFRVSCAQPIVYDTVFPERYGLVDEALRYFLRYLFGHTEFRQGQANIIRRALARKPTLGILPTGSGKSLCYQMASLLQPCISFVVCPIISLIQDQDINARSLGLCHVGRIDSQMDRGSKNEVLEGFGRLRYQFIWISPERFQTKDFRERLREIGNHASFGYAVIDEAHCLSEWGHDFRVSYLKLHGTIHHYCPQAVTLALTATASPKVLKDLLVELHISKRDVQTSPSLDRPELHYHVVRTTEANREAALNRILDEINETFRAREGVPTIFKPLGENGEDSICGIVFANLRSNKRRPSASCSGVVSLLARRGAVAGEYHSGIDKKRAQVQDAFINNEFTVMAATKAFGMGVNKKNVRYTIHDGLPWSIEAFYQEAGRAGRDDVHNESECYILYSNDSPRAKVEKLFARGTSINEVRESSEELGGDLGTLSYLWSKDREDIEVEVQAIKAVFKRLMAERNNSGTATIGFDLVKTLPDVKQGIRIGTQDVLYKLALLGIVEDWTIDYRTKTYEVLVKGVDSLSEESVRKALEGYIRRYDPQFSFDNKRDSDDKYIDAYEKAPIGNKLVGLIRALLLWTDDNIVYNRRQAIRHMLDQCEKRSGKKEFRQYINNFFRLDTAEGDQLDCILETVDDLDVWVRLFTRLDNDSLTETEMLKDLDEIKAVSALCDHYRESYQTNIGLAWATMVAHLLADDYSREETSSLFSFIHQEARGYEGLDVEDLFRRTLDLVKYGSPGAQNTFGAAVVEHVPHRVAEVYEQIGDMSTLGHLVMAASLRLRETWGRMAFSE